MTIVPATSEHISKAAALLRSGKLVAFPTETVYGLGGDATNDKAVAAIYAAKGRPEFNPLIVHVAGTLDAQALVEWNDTAQLLANRFWPGPLTLVLPRKPDCPVSLLAGAGLDTLAVRMPAHPVALDLLRATGRPIAAPSANAFGKLSPTTPQHVTESLGANVDMILDGGQSAVGVESTVIDLTTPLPTILRPGGVTREQLEQSLCEVFEAVSENAVIKSPGMTSSHYAPNIPLRLAAKEAAPGEALLAFGPDAGVKGGAARLNLSATGDLNEAAANLFAMLRQLDQPHLRGIAVMPIPETGLGVAINDRLRRAATLLDHN
ncbi:MAG: L-threonylcarbamoyladenylate synthase [Alphaproteobacteria bacterium]|nr:L-threonylcarbamoyladenylate synthase [Alphaproteobacteria bacterium]